MVLPLRLTLFLGVVFSDGIVAGGDHGHESDTHPTDNKDVALPPEHSLSTSKFPSRKLAEVLEDLGCSMNQLEGAAGMNPIFIQLLGQGNEVVVVIHEYMVTLANKMLQETENSILKSSEGPGVHAEVTDVPGAGLAQKIYFRLYLCGIRGL